MVDHEDRDPEFFKLGTKVQNVLQVVENTLHAAGYDDFVVKTERGSFRWQTTERAREAEPRLPSKEKWLPGDIPGAVERDGEEPDGRSAGVK